MSWEEAELNPVNMLLDAIRWNMLNVIRVELFFNCYKIWNIFINSSLQSARGQYAIISLLITLLAQTAVQFNLGWLLSLYSIYLVAGMSIWLYRRVYFYHRKLDPAGVDKAIGQIFDSETPTLNHHIVNGSATLKADKQNGLSSSSSASSAGAGPLSLKSNNGAGMNSSNNNSLKRQTILVYRNFQRILNEPRRNHKEYVMSLAHLSNASKLVADKDVFDEMHFQLLATRRDVVNVILRAVLLSAATFLAYFR